VILHKECFAPGYNAKEIIPSLKEYRMPDKGKISINNVTFFSYFANLCYNDNDNLNKLSHEKGVYFARFSEEFGVLMP